MAQTIDRNMIVRRAEFEDGKALAALMQDTGGIPLYRATFNTFNFSVIIENSFVSVIATSNAATESDEQPVIGFMAANDSLPLFNEPEACSKVLHAINLYIPAMETNSLFLNFWMINEAMKGNSNPGLEMVKMVLAACPYVDYILWVCPKSFAISDYTNRFFSPLKMDAVDDEMVRILDGYQVYVLARSNFLPKLLVREARVEDNDDLIPILRDSNPDILVGQEDYFLADLINSQDERNRFYVGLQRNNIVGMLATSLDVNVALIMKLFDIQIYSDIIVEKEERPLPPPLLITIVGDLRLLEVSALQEAVTAMGCLFINGETMDIPLPAEDQLSSDRDGDIAESKSPRFEGKEGDEKKSADLQVEIDEEKMENTHMEGLSPLQLLIEQTLANHQKEQAVAGVSTKNLVPPAIVVFGYPRSETEALNNYKQIVHDFDYIIEIHNSAEDAEDDEEDEFLQQHLDALEVLRENYFANEGKSSGHHHHHHRHHSEDGTRDASWRKVSVDGEAHAPSENLQYLCTDLDKILEHRTMKIEAQRAKDNEEPPKANAFAVTVFCLTEDFNSRGIDLLKMAFEDFPHHDYCLFMVSNTNPPPQDLLRCLNLVNTRAGVSFDQSLYVMHRSAFFINDHLHMARLSKDNNNNNGPFDNTVSVPPPTKPDESTRRIYASNAPKIVLETITANTATVIIALTYIFFIIGFSIDFYTTYRSFNSNNLRLHAENCDDTNTHITSGNDYYGCTDGNHWKAEITQRSNVISVKLNVQRENITDSFFVNKTDSTTKIKYNVHLWACYDKHGCGNDFKSNTHYTKDPNVWQLVLKNSNEVIDLNIDSDLKSDVHGTDGYKSNLIPSIFQNQEAIPTNGLVRSYYINLDYEQDDYGIYSVNDGAYASDVKYYFDVVERPRQTVINCFFVILLFITLLVVVGYAYIMWNQVKRKKRVLSEQKWVLGYFLLLVLFQNPIYVVIVWYKSNPPIGAAYASYVLEYIAKSGLFVLWLLFADSVHRKMINKFIFYTPKLFIGLAIFTIGICILTFQFPGLDPSNEGHSDRNAVEAVANWSDNQKHEFIGFTFLYLLLIWLWTIWWFGHLFWTGRQLKKLPYMSTRYIQLSYRFFSLQATLVTLYYVFQYFAVIYFISAGTNSNDINNTNFTDNINILFRQQTQLFGKTLFLTVYALILAFLFLPSELLDNSHGLLAALAATYVISEHERNDLVHQRKLLVTSMKRSILNQVTLMNQILNAKVDVFCVDFALMLRSVSFQAYYDPPGIETVSGFDGQMNLGKIGFSLIDTLYNKDHEVFCFIAKEDATGRLVVGFRGTASKRQMEDNLKYKQRAVDFYALDTHSLDQLDGLDFKTVEGEDRFDLESIDEDDQELNLEEIDVESGSSTFGDRQFSEGRAYSLDGQTIRESVKDGAGRVGGGMKRVLQGTVDVGAAVVETTAGLMKTAASKTPGLKNIVKVFVHSGFWEAYEFVRVFIHAILRRELARNPTTVFFTGHSLGGALATFAALDVSIHTIPRINAYLKHQEKVKLARNTFAADIQRPTLFSSFSRTLTSRTFHTQPKNDSTVQRSSNSLPGGVSIQMESPASSGFEPKRKFVNKIKVFMYNFGSPRVGNRNFAQMFDKIVPNSYRVVVDGDIVSALPPPGKYTHIGTEILIDSVGAGSIIIDPSFVERWLRTHIKSSVSVHSLLVYRKGLVGIKLAAEAMRDIASKNKSFDELRIGLNVRTVQDVDNVADENAGVAAPKDSKENVRKDAGTAEGVDSDGSNGSKGSVSSSFDLLSKHGRNASTEDGRNADSAAYVLPTISTDSASLSQECKHLKEDERIMDAFQMRLRDIRKGGPINWIRNKAKKMGKLVNKDGEKNEDQSAHQPTAENSSGTVIGSVKGTLADDGGGHGIGRTTLSRIIEDDTLPDNQAAQRRSGENTERSVSNSYL